MALAQLKKPIILSILSLFCLSCSLTKGGRKQSVMAGTWQQKPIAIDGDCQDWPSPYPNYDAKAKVAYATSNDAEYLYITLQTGDPLTQIKILKQGMSVYIDTTGRKNETYTINYPLQNDDDLTAFFVQNDNQTSSGPTRLSRQFDQKLQKSAESSIQYSLEGFGTCNGGNLVSQASPCGINVKINVDEYKQLVWEAAIPFSAIFNKKKISAADAKKPISVCFSVKSFKAPSTKGASSPSMPNNSMNQNGMGGGSMNSMPMNTGVGGKSTNPMQHIYESTKTWKHFELAWQ